MPKYTQRTIEAALQTLAAKYGIKAANALIEGRLRPDGRDGFDPNKFAAIADDLRSLYGIIVLDNDDAAEIEINPHHKIATENAIDAIEKGSELRDDNGNLNVVEIFGRYNAPRPRAQ